MTEKDFVPSLPNVALEAGEVHCTAPSNIALIKYWGKYPGQLPANPSISFTLDACTTSTRVRYEKRQLVDDEVAFDFLFEGNPKPEFEPKLRAFFERTAAYLPFLNAYHLQISSTNSFPHSSGIASSASAMAALASCLVEMEVRQGTERSRAFWEAKASFLARLGSGSACRSIAGGLVVWGAHADIDGSSDRYGVPFPDKVHEVFRDYQDTILLVHRGQKQISSTLGHKLMEGHPFAEERFRQAHQNMKSIKRILAEGDLERFVSLVESEALTLHAMMMTSSPYFVLMKPNTLAIIENIWKYREATGIPLCFTLDAGANVHLLYPKANREKVLQFIKNELVAYCENGQYICDQVGSGAKLS